MAIQHGKVRRQTDFTIPKKPAAPRRQVATGHFTGDLTMAGPAGRIVGEGQRRWPQPQNAMVPLGLNAIGDWGERYVGAVVFVFGGAQDFAAAATMDVEW
jgi:hypothetical protein